VFECRQRGLGCDAPEDVPVEPLEQHGVASEAGQLESQQDQVDPLRVLVVVAFGGRQAEQVAGDAPGPFRLRCRQALKSA
jgi:hypothetical protein